jgi:hypothetical protein
MLCGARQGLLSKLCPDAPLTLSVDNDKMIWLINVSEVDATTHLLFYNFSYRSR